jgi:hypothetical protein
MKPKEFWIFKGTSNFCQELVYDIYKDQDVKARPDGFYDIVSTADTVEGGIHVREVTPGAVTITKDELLDIVGECISWDNDGAAETMSFDWDRLESLFAPDAEGL